MAGSDGRIAYRADIDGLRAIAVGLVVLDHANLGPFSGGYIGVDIFFVISGFLITGLIVADQDRGTFSFCAFYERRARRILPALLVMLLATTGFALAIFPPTDLREFAASLPPSLFFYANSHMRRVGDYFGPAADSIPLLHLWSISVEEQFYVAFPLLVAILRPRIGRHFRWLLLAAVAALLLYATYRVGRVPERAYFGTPERAWELLFGATIRLFPLPMPQSPRLRGAISTVGVALIGACALAFGPGSGLPGIAALGPVLGAGLILADRGGGLAFLTAAPLVQIGKWSYSIYLWHWPLLVGVTFLQAGETPVGLRVALAGLAVLLGGISYRYIETPFRRVDGLFPLRRFVAAATGALVVLVGAWSVVGLTDGLSNRLPPAVLATTAALDAERAQNKSCGPALAPPQAQSCWGREAETLLVGDSHAGALAAGLVSEAGFANLHVDWLPGCPPVVTIPVFGFWGVRETAVMRDCREQASARTGSWLRHTAGTVIIALRWPLYADDRMGVARSGARFSWVLSGLRDLAERLGRTGKTVVIIGPTPEQVHPVPSLLERAGLSLPVGVGKSRRAYEAEIGDVLTGLGELERAPHIAVVYPHEVLCEAGTCRATRNGRPLQYDDNHLSRDGAALVASKIAAAMEGLKARAGTADPAERRGGWTRSSELTAAQ